MISFSPHMPGVSKLRAHPTAGPRNRDHLCVLEGLALKYRWVLIDLKRCWATIEPIHIIGGGTGTAAQSTTADATADRCRRPIEATIGKVLMQAVALGQLTSGGRLVVRHSFKPETYGRTLRRDVAYQKL
jgi:sugar (pentulose or hexulose) kinase